MKTEIKRVQVPVSLRTLIECDNAARTDPFGGGDGCENSSEES
jgi:hypothetical protein